LVRALSLSNGKRKREGQGANVTRGNPKKVVKMPLYALVSGNRHAWEVLL
jgi:hypothetical protein